MIAAFTPEKMRKLERFFPCRIEKTLQRRSDRSIGGPGLGQIDAGSEDGKEQHRFIQKEHYMYKLILADADDTLFDFSRTERSAVERTFAGIDAGMPQEDLIAEYHRINKKLWKEVEEGTMDTKRLRSERFRRLFDELSLPYSAVEFGEQYIRYLSEGTDLLEGAEELCRKWSAQCPLVIVTNGIADVQRARIEHSAIRGYISGLIISEEIGTSKPDPRMFEAAFACVGHTEKMSAVMIGDSLSSDILGGMNFGIDTCWYNPKGMPNTLGKEPTYEIKTLKELKNII